MPGTWDNITYTTNTTDWMTYQPITATDYIANWNTKISMPPVVTEERLEKLLRDIYKIIEEHTQIDISEDEFITLLKEEDT